MAGDTRISTRRFALWTQLFKEWLNTKFSSISVDTTGLATEENATANKNAIISAMSEISVDTSNLATKAVEQWLGLEESYEAEAKGGERTNNTVIDECKVRFQDAFNGLLPTGFTMPNSVTVDNLTYTGTTNS